LNERALAGILGNGAFSRVGHEMHKARKKKMGPDCKEPWDD